MGRLIFLVLFFPVIVLSDQLPPIELDEKSLTEAALRSAPGLKEIEASLQSIRLNRDSFNDQFGWRLQSDMTYQKANEKGLAEFDAVTIDATQIQAAVIKPYANGVQVGLSAFTNQISNTFVENSTNTGVGLSLSVDLMKNFLGKLSSSQLKNAQILTQKAELEREIQEKAFLQNLRKIYWSITATKEQILISQGLLDTALRQLKDTEQRRKSNVADSGDVARSRSQVASRRSNILLLEYQLETQMQQLKEMIPEFANREIILKEVSLSKTISDVLVCTTLIQSNRSVPYDYTKYDEVIKLVNEAYEEQRISTNAINTWDLKLNGEVQYFGKAYSYNNSFRDITDDSQNRMSVGLQLNIPLDGKRATTEETQRILDEKRFLSEKDAIQAKIEAFHTQTLRNIALLQQAVRTQGENSKDLSESLRSAQNKFEQARLSFRELIADQDLLLQSNLDEVRTKLTVITTLLDYFSVFHTTPCPLNQ